MQNKKTKFAVLVRMDSSNNWYRGPLRFATREDAEEYGWNEFQRHPSYQEYRVVEMAEEGDGHGAE